MVMDNQWSWRGVKYTLSKNLLTVEDRLSKKAIRLKHISYVSLEGVTAFWDTTIGLSLGLLLFTLLSLLLKSLLKNPITWAGLALISIAITGFLVYGVLGKKTVVVKYDGEKTLIRLSEDELEGFMDALTYAIEKSRSRR